MLKIVDTIDVATPGSLQHSTQGPNRKASQETGAPAEQWKENQPHPSLTPETGEMQT